ncbi:MAG: DUF1294 domain-containing protein [Ruminococcaceae bacterium]|nr:DUF1294 domain-containing protein [Oscillospiraceae bacterium]
MTVLYAYLIIINAAGFLFMLTDKRRAQRNLWRIPERTLIAVALLGGSLGALLGMKLFRHKTKHDKFRIGIPIILSVQILFAVLIYIFIQK